MYILKGTMILMCCSEVIEYDVGFGFCITILIQVLGYGALLYHVVCLSNGNVAFSAGMGLVF